MKKFTLKSFYWRNLTKKRAQKNGNHDLIHDPHRFSLKNCLLRYPHISIPHSERALRVFFFSAQAVHDPGSPGEGWQPLHGFQER